MTMAEHLLRYLKSHPNLDIAYKRGQFTLHGYTDTSFASDPDNRSSTSGYLFIMAGEPISFGAKTQTLTAQTTVESEVITIILEARNQPTHPTS